MSPRLELAGASVRYQGVPALIDVTLTIEPGERVALVGRSGAGKSTLLRLLYEQARSETALVAQDLALVKTLSVFHNVYMSHLRRHGALYNLVNLLRPIGREVDAVRPLLRRLDLEEKLFEPAGQLSGGQQQRTAIARALHQGSPVMMADEPVSAVDEHQSRRVMDAIMEASHTVVLAMHDIGLALEYADRVVGLEGGRVTLDNPTAGMRRTDLDGLYGA